jgi:hypothetical protein
MRITKNKRFLPFSSSRILIFICLVFITFITLSQRTINMASIIPGYNYDIFISYRQKDNKYDGWVTEFVDHLNREIEATFKEDISICFDENPLDRLLETHNVNTRFDRKRLVNVFL